MMKIVKITALVAVAVLIYQASNSELWQYIADENWVKNYLANRGLSGTVTLVLFGALFTGCGAPRQVIAFTFGFAFGSVWGTLYCLISTLCGALSSYTLAHLLFKPTLVRWLGDRLHQFRRFVRDAPFSKILMLRLLPIGNNLVTNILSGIASVPIWAFISASLLGYLPQTIIFALAGSGISAVSHWQLISSIALTILSMLLTGYLYQKYRQSHSKPPI